MPLAKRLVSVIVMMLALYIGWRRVNRAGRGALGRGRLDGAPGAGPVAARTATVGGGVTTVPVRRTPSSKYLEASEQPTVVCVTVNRIVLVDSGVVDRTGSSSYVFVDGVLPILCAMAPHTQLHLLAKCPSPLHEQRVLTAFQRSPLFTAGLRLHRVLFCTSSIGKQNMIRHIAPNLVIDDEKDVCQHLLPHIEDVVLVNPHALSTDGLVAPRTSRAIVTVPSLSHYFFPLGNNLATAPKSPVGGFTKSASSSSTSTTTSLTSAPSEF